MAKSIRAKATAKRLRRGPTFIQRSRSVSSEQKAIWHQVTGAGRSQVVREFLGATEEDERALMTTLEQAVAARTGATER